jgi:transcriptional regulator with XRE-family HTH domain
MKSMHTADWITAFDWSDAAAHAGTEAELSTRLLVALPNREGVGELADSAEAAAFGRYVAALRHARGWSRTQLAEQAGIDPIAVPLLEEAALTTQELSPGLVSRLARALEIPLEDLVINPLAERLIVEAPRMAFGRWLREQLQALSAGAGLLPAPRLIYRGISDRAEEDRLSEQVRGLLVQPLPLPEQVLTMPDGRMLQVSPTLIPVSPPQPGIADLLVLVQDTQGKPVSGIALEVELAGLPFVGTVPSDTQGVLRIPDVSLELLARLERLDLRLV